jgi:hypothetical protein
MKGEQRKRLATRLICRAHSIPAAFIIRWNMSFVGRGRKVKWWNVVLVLLLRDTPARLRDFVLLGGSICICCCWEEVAFNIFSSEIGERSLRQISCITSTPSLDITTAQTTSFYYCF